MSALGLMYIYDAARPHLVNRGSSQALVVTRDRGLPDDVTHVNPNSDAISIGHLLGASGARHVTTAMYQLIRKNGRNALYSMCIGVGQGIAMIIERV